jgi:hypothetical protein
MPVEKNIPVSAIEGAMTVFKWIADFVRFMNRNPLLVREIEHCNQHMKDNQRFAPRDRRSSTR